MISKVVKKREGPYFCSKFFSGAFQSIFITDEKWTSNFFCLSLARKGSGSYFHARAQFFFHKMPFIYLLNSRGGTKVMILTLPNNQNRLLIHKCLESQTYLIGVFKTKPSTGYTIFSSITSYSNKILFMKVGVIMKDFSLETDDIL